MKRLYRAVIDTSTIISAVLSSTGASREILRLALDSKFLWLLSKPIANEYRRVLKRKKITKYSKLSPQLILEMDRFIEHLIQPVSKRLKIVRDSEDDMIVECAVEYEADFIVSLDKDLLVLNNYGPIKIIRPKEFLPYIKKG